MDSYEKTDKQLEIEWAHYLAYLRQWTDDHKEMWCYGMSPAMFEEWCDNEAEEDKED